MTPGRPGLAPQRTALAWQRTAFDFVIVAGLLLQAAAGSRPLRLLPGLAALAVAAAILLGLRRRRSGPGTVAAVGAATVVVGLCAAVLVLPIWR